MSEEYRIPKYRVAVDLLLTGQATLHADLFLGELAERHSGRELPLDLLNGTKTFFPVRHEERGTVLIRRAALLTASLSAEVALQNDPSAQELLSEAEVEGTDAREVEVELLLEEGTELSGTVAYVLPRGEQRLQDFLNSSEAFFRLWDGDTLHLVNRDRVVRIRAATP